MTTTQELEQKISSLKKELSRKDDVLRRKNIALDAMYWVWCDGGCSGGVNRNGFMPPLTEEMVQAAEANIVRLRRWYNNVTFRKKMKELQERYYGVHSLVLWYLAHMERGTFDRIMSEPHHPKDEEKIEAAKKLFDALKQNE